ncbi:hypothetical protein NQ318_010236 [Aromia moschata]|uniref:Ig-like domain-containing protein n=1 Tax=Aromia moschata TaxID=1265417 RepID=A0AAV8YJX6_9CUCU|nr:hypothetical protein NQ318_010236 [Aromia moschata]
MLTIFLPEAEAVIIGGPRKEVEKPGSPLRLSCFLNNSIEAPDYIFWYHEDRMINYDLGDGATVRDGRQGSELIFPIAQRKHAGNYSCVPSNARQASVEVVFLSRDTEGGDGEGSCAKKSQSRDHIVNMLVLALALHLYRRRYSLQT